AAPESTFWKFHPHLPATRTWGYWSDSPRAGLPYLGPTILATRRPNDTVETSVAIEWRNELGNAFLPNDPTLMGAVMPGEPAPIVTHLHGGENHPQFDGTPLQWFTKGGKKGPHYITNRFTYYNEQRASMVWYHDHALGNTRTNVYAGLAGAYIIRDEHDTGEHDNPLGLPAGPCEIPLVLQDKTFNADGSMFYPTQGVTADHPQWVPEFFGDVAVVNAKIWPFVDVEPRRYRLRIVNGSQSRFYNLQFVHEHSRRALRFTQIGAEGGLLRAPVAMTALLIAPGERADVIVDIDGHRHASAEDPRQPAAERRGPHDPARQPEPASARRATRAIGHPRAAPLRNARPGHRRAGPPQRRGRPLPEQAHTPARGNDEAQVGRHRGLAAGQHARGYTPHAPAPRDLRGDRPQAVRRRRLRPHNAGDHLHRTPGPRCPQRERPQGHRPGPPRAGHPHPRQVRPPRRGHNPTPTERRRHQPAIRLALPHPRARRERHDARVRSRPVTAARDENVLVSCEHDA